MYEDYEDLSYFETQHIKDDEFDLFDKREVECFEVSKWDWACISCGCVNTENKKPRFTDLVYCAECGEVFSAVVCDE